jgi:hypothetical protein
MKIFIAAFASMLLLTSAFAETGPLKRFGVPKGFRVASDEVVKGFQMPQPYGFVIGDEGETNEIWFLQSKTNFEHAVSRIMAWLVKNQLTLVQLECGSQQNQHCEFMARNKMGSISLNLASARPKKDFLVLVIRMEGPEGIK